MTYKMLMDKYILDVQNTYSAGESTEHSFRNTLKDLLMSMNNQIRVQNESERIRGVGMPDLTVQDYKNREIKIGRVECKDIWIDLDYKKNTDQLDRYIGAFDNFIYTNHLEFVFYRNGKIIETVSLGKFDDKNKKIIWSTEDIFGDKIAKLSDLLSSFLNYGGQTITSSIKLAQVMAAKAKLISYAIKAILNSEDKDSELFGQFNSFQQVLIHDLTIDNFADMYAQTIVYGLFAARINDKSPANFSRAEASKLLPKTNPFLRRLFNQISIDDATDNRISYIIDDLILIFRATDMEKVMATHGKNTAMQDPILHFYETFLGEYDPSMRKSRGVYYTPQPVVDFIVKSVDKILVKDFGLSMGLADTSKIDHICIDPQDVTRKKTLKKEIHKVQVLDPATGTGTFLDTVIKYIYNGYFDGQAGVRSDYVKKDLLPRIHGFELLMASYAMCHLKLGQTLKTLGYDNSSDQRLGVYLTNSLEEPSDDLHTLFSSVLAKESKEASQIKKDQPIMIVIGNPPYSGVSTNKSKRISDKIEDYKYIDGVHFGEKKHWLQDDYVKFIRLAEDFIERNQTGILAYINPHGFIDNPTFRGMRRHLASTFDDIYITDLHGNSKKKEKHPDGSVDNNVFDIMQGVSINIFVKNNKKKIGDLATIHHTDIYGRRDDKYKFLADSDIYQMNSLTSLSVDNGLHISQSKSFVPTAPYYFFVAKDETGRAEYDLYISITDIFGENKTGIVTMGDEFAISSSKDQVRSKLADFLSNIYTDKQLSDKYNLGKNYASWILSNKSIIKLDEKNIVTISYRPFDSRYTYYDNKILRRWRNETMQHFTKGDNL